MTLSNDSLSTWSEHLGRVAAEVATSNPGESPRRQPVHTVYGGAQLFTSQTVPRLGELALRHVEQWAPTPGDLAEIAGMSASLAAQVHPLVIDKLGREPVEDYRIDFEDGYGNRPDEEEDGHARSAAVEVARALEGGTLCPFSGIRIKSLAGDLHMRSLRTLNIFITTLIEEAGALPPGFVVTLPKITSPVQVEVLGEALEALEGALGIDSIPIELMIETPQTVLDLDGASGARRYAAAGGGRVRGAHFGTYDYTASLNVTASYQTMDHPACDFARHVLQVSLAGSGVWISDGATNVMPVPLHRGDGLSDDQMRENTETVRAAMRLQYDHVRHSLSHAYYQGWDLHPGQLPTRYAAIYSFFLEGLEPAGVRLRNFVESAAKATLVGEVFDDAATGQGLLNFFLRALNCGAVTEEEATGRTGLTLDELRTRSFLRILEGRRG